MTIPCPLKAQPFFGIIGVAPRPEDGPQTSIIPRAFGGNIDNKNLGAGATLHLPVFNPGGLFSVGDGHAIQGDGEVCLTAIETALRGTLRVSVKKGGGITRPWAETPTHWITMSFEEDLDRAAQDAVRSLIEQISGAFQILAPRLATSFMQTCDKKSATLNPCRNPVGITTRPPNVIGWHSLRRTKSHAPVISKTVITGWRLPHVLMRQRKR